MERSDRTEAKKTMFLDIYDDGRIRLDVQAGCGPRMLDLLAKLSRLLPRHVSEVDAVQAALSAKFGATPTQQAAGEPVGEVKVIARVPSGVPGFMSDVLGGVLDQGKVKAGDKLFTHPAPAVPDGWTVAAYKAAGLTIQSMAQLKGPDLWKIADAAGNVLNKQGEWEWEPTPSNRDDEFLARCRYATLTEASAMLAAAQAKGGQA